MKRVIFILFLLSPGLLCAKEYTYKDFLADVKKTNKTIRAQKENVKVKEAAIMSAKSVNDFTITGEGGYTFAQSKNQAVSYQPEEIKGYNIYIGASRIVKETGLIGSVKYGYEMSNYGWASGNSFGLTSVDNYSPSISFEIIQPLLRNIGGPQYQLPVKLAKYQKDLSEIEEKETTESILASASSVYFTWYVLDKQIALTTSLIEKIQEQKKWTEKQLRDGLVEEEELHRISSTLFENESFKVKLQAALKYYKKLLQTYFSQERDLAELIPLLPSLNLEPKGNDFIDKNSRVAKLIQITEKMQEETMVASKNDKLPDLSLLGSYKLHGNGTEFNDAHGSNFENNDFFIGLTLSIPLFNNDKKGAYLSEYHNLKKIKLENAQSLYEFKKTFAGLKEQIELYTESIDKLKKSIEHSKNKIKFLEIKYKKARISLFELLTEQMALLGSEMSFEQMLVDRLNLIVKAKEILDELYI